MWLYSAVAIGCCVWLLDRSLCRQLIHPARQPAGRTVELAASERFARFAMLSAGLLLVFLLGGLAALIGGAAEVWHSDVLPTLAPLAVMAVFLIFVYIGIPHFLFCFNLFGRHFAPIMEHPMVLPAWVRAALSGPAIVMLCGFSLIGFVEFMQFEIPRSALYAALGLVGVAFLVSLLAHYGSQQALQPLFEYARSVRDATQPRAETPQARSLDEIGEMTRQVGQIVAREQENTRKLQESETRFRMFAEAASDWFYEIDADLNFSYVSENSRKSPECRSTTSLGCRRLRCLPCTRKPTTIRIAMT